VWVPHPLTALAIVLLSSIATSIITVMALVLLFGSGL
jgi:hypothetical protein